MKSRSDFDATLENGAKAAAIDVSSDSRVLPVAFRGFGGRVSPALG